MIAGFDEVIFFDISARRAVLYMELNSIVITMDATLALLRHH